MTRLGLCHKTEQFCKGGVSENGHTTFGAREKYSNMDRLYRGQT